MDKPVYEDRDYRLLKLITHTGDAVFRARKNELNEYGLSPRQAAVVVAIQAIGEKATSAEIARWLYREHHTVSGILNRMEKDGLVKKVRNRGGKKLTRIVLTEKGRQAYNQSSKIEALHEIMSFISDEERQQLKACLEKIRDAAFKKIGMNHKPPFP